jgi:uncharacterized protein (TIGR03083 family)
MDKDEAWRVIHRERVALADLLESLTPQEWETPSLCDGWTVRDVAAHVIGAPQFGISAVPGALLRARGNLNRMTHDEAQRWARRPTSDIVADYRRLQGIDRPAPFTTWREALTDTLVHTQDICIPLGRHHDMPREAARVAAISQWRPGWPFYPKRRLRGLRLEATDIDWAVGEGPGVRGPMWALLLLLTGRPAAVPHLSGEGVTRLRRSFERAA